MPITPRSISIRRPACRSIACSTSRGGFATSSTSLGATGVPKTSGADGLHIYIPLPPGTPYEAGLIFCQIVATVVAQKHPKVATVERSVRARGPRVYVDYLQNILGKTLATAYSARASDYAGVSTPLTWQEVDRGVRREEFTIKTMPARLRVGIF